MRSQSSSKFVVDRIEGDKAVLTLYDDDEVGFALPLSCLPEGTRGGDHIQAVFTQDSESREDEKKRAERLLEELTGHSQS